MAARANPVGWIHTTHEEPSQHLASTAEYGLRSSMDLAKEHDNWLKDNDSKTIDSKTMSQVHKDWKNVTDPQLQ